MARQPKRGGGEPWGDAMNRSWSQDFFVLHRQVAAWWRAQTQRDRTLLRIGAGATLLFSIWFIGLRPALDNITQARQELSILHIDAAQVDAYIIESRALQHRESGKLDPLQLGDALGSSLQRAGLTATSETHELHPAPAGSSRQWTVDFAVADAERVMEWLAGLSYLLQVRTDEVQLSRANVDGRDRPGYVSGRVVLSLPSAGRP